MSNPDQRFTRRAYKAFRLFVRFLAIAIFLLVGAFVFLRIHGVPDPLLREAVRRANAAGIPVDVENITLTLGGWRADNVRYYSKHPDDLAPLFHAERVLFVRKDESSPQVSNAWNFDVEAEGITMEPSVEWGVSIPLESGFRKVDYFRLSLGFHPDRIELTDGTMSWLGARFKVNGTILKREKETEKAPDVERGPVKTQETVLPVFIDEQKFQALENHFKSVMLGGSAEIEIDFMVDTGNYAASRIDFGMQTSDISFRGVDFSGSELSGSYAYPTVELSRAVLFKDNHSAELSCRYNLDSGLMEGIVRNSIVSKRLLLLLPQPILDLLVKAQLRFDYLPRFSVEFGPAQTKDLLNALTGSFSIAGINYYGLEIDTLEGRLSRRNNRLDLSDLSGSVLGQEERAEETGSCMVGGAATGAVFWDLNTHEFGVEASGSFDPTLLIEPLSMIDIATNIIARFRFKDRPPQASLRLGSCYLDASTFYIDIQGMGNDVSYEDVEFSSMNISAFYKLGVLRFDPIAAMQGVDFMKGSASIDFFNSIATFDAFGSLHPAALEDAICPGFNL
ncbi:MAG: hypothetical protein U9P12_04965, partial [Verrucomicrobiota bacterium]|nr:hypothetical protein [Verrucomicrobiota bacterium]